MDADVPWTRTSRGRGRPVDADAPRTQTPRGRGRPVDADAPEIEQTQTRTTRRRGLGADADGTSMGFLNKTSATCSVLWSSAYRFDFPASIRSTSEAIDRVPVPISKGRAVVSDITYYLPHHLRLVFGLLESGRAHRALFKIGSSVIVHDSTCARV